MAPTESGGRDWFAVLTPDIRKAFRDPPPWGYVGFRVHFVDGEPNRIEYEASVSRRMNRDGGPRR